jgi:hypothetical protein
MKFLFYDGLWSIKKSVNPKDHALYYD